MIRVLHIVESLEASAGSYCNLLADAISHLPASGIETDVVALRGNGRAPASITSVADVITLARPEGEEFRDRVAPIVARSDVVHLHGALGRFTDAAARLAGRADVPTVVSPHASLGAEAMQRFGLRGFASRVSTRRRMRRAACVHAESRPELERILDRRMSERVELIRPGLNAEPYERPADPEAMLRQVPALRDHRCLLFLGRIHPMEGIVPLMRACEELVEGMAGWHLVLAGPVAANWHTQMEAAIRRRGETGRVTVLVSPDAELQRALLGRADLLIHPALYESVPVSALQALASGVPVVVSTHCDVPEVGQNDAGVEVEPRREAIRAALDRLLREPGARLKEMGRNGPALVREHFAAGTVASRLANLYRSLADRR